MGRAVVSAQARGRSTKHDRARGAHRADTGAAPLRAPHEPLPVGVVLHVAAVPRADRSRGGAPGRRRPRVLGLVGLTGNRAPDREPVPAVLATHAVHGRARPRDRRDARAAPVNVATASACAIITPSTPSLPAR